MGDTAAEAEAWSCSELMIDNLELPAKRNERKMKDLKGRKVSIASNPEFSRGVRVKSLT